MRWGAVGVVVAALLPGAASAQVGDVQAGVSRAGVAPASIEQVAMASDGGKSYAVTAQCLTSRMTNSQIGGVAVIFVPPTTEAYVHLWQRGSEHGVPIGIFLVREGASGGTTISFTETQRGRLMAAARAAVDHCSK